MRKEWYTYLRNGFIYVQFINKITGKKMTAKSTRTRDPAKAEKIIHQWYYNQDSFFNIKQKDDKIGIIELAVENATHRALQKAVPIGIQHDEKLIASLSQTIDQTVSETLSKFFVDAAIKGEDKKSIQNQIRAIESIEEKSAEMREPGEKFDGVTFKDYLFNFFDYDKSPYITQLQQRGKSLPMRPRFRNMFLTFRLYERFFSNTLLADIEADEINSILGAIKNTGNLADSSMCALVSSICQALKFAYENDVISHLITSKITRFSKKNKKKEIFTNSELKRIFDERENVFNNERYALINELLFKTGCRIGEILALQIKDFRQTLNGYELFIGSNYDFREHALGPTKTKREDVVPITKKLGEKLIHCIEQSPFKDDPEAFIFYSPKFGKSKPLSYAIVNRDFQIAMKKLGITRKNLTLHSYRHTYASMLRDAGYSDSELQYLTRHDSIDLVYHYANHVTPAMQRKKIAAAELIDELA
ncbi:MAG: site-specific integrase [Treponema phagedenis]|uniref:Site-specific integrase n=2 Tax=Treponema phagedenis TaxID=162 RepID=A0A0B7GT60_TREPH|nr:site-specific integrase [Treponema phagedenis]QEJ94693.1 site-specific integrase [Treponema phagedenis]QEJ97353.1 site-specific integrase [Treponema phagedenis]QEJ98176.1 site-specific integrase [Treponema phagedenis]QEJ98620.1 site-specific integrase [Treponema phagedenis]QEJ99968.1 site-specific integrase [Treponema phagedenis]